VTVTVNSYYGLKTRTLAPGGRLEIPIRNLETATGQRYDKAREPVRTVDVRATASSGRAVTLEWRGEVRLR